MIIIDRELLMSVPTLSVVHGLINTTNTQEAFLKDFLEILKHLFKRFPHYFLHSDIDLAGLNLALQCVTHIKTV